MALRVAIGSIRASFSLFKKKCQPIQLQHYESFGHLYEELCNFERNLDVLEVKRMDKKLLDFDKKFKRLFKQDNKGVYAIPMQVNHTYLYFTKTSDSLTFGTQQIENEVSLQQMTQITRNMSNLSINQYYCDFLPNIHKWDTLHIVMQQRFTTLEERLSRLLFNKYYNFSRKASKLSFLQQRQYKGQYTFELVDNLQVFEEASQCLYHCAQLNQLRNKLVLACEKIVGKYWDKLSPEALGRYLYCLATAGRSVKVLNDKMFDIMLKLKDFPINLLFYLTVSQFQEYVILKTVIEENILEPKNINELQLMSIIAPIMKTKFEFDVPIKKGSQLKMPFQKHGGELFFDQFLQRYQYKYFSNWNEAICYNVFDIQNKKFVCLDHRSIMPEDYKLNGLGHLYKQYFSLSKTPLKHINWPRMLSLPKRMEKDEYILSKFKGIPRPKIIKQRYYD